MHKRSVHKCPASNSEPFNLINNIEINIARRFANNKSNHILIQTHIFVVEVNLTSKIKITNTFKQKHC